MAPDTTGPPDTPPAAPPDGSLFSQLTDPAVAVVLSDGEPTVRAVNQAFVHTFDVDQQAIRDTPLRTVLIENVVDDPLPTGFERAFRSADPSSFTVGDSNGGERTYRCTAIRQSTQSSESAEWLQAIDGWLVFADVTDAYERIEDLRSERDTLRAVIRHVSHDVRNPLEVADIHLEAARETGDVTHFERVSWALTRIEQLVSEVLPLPVSDSSPVTREPVALQEAARRAWDAVNTREATLSVDNDLPTVRVNVAQLQTLFENLFRNAVEHGGGDVSVRVGRTADGFYVADDGVGLPSGRGDELFEPGQSTSEQGRGYGLAIVRSVGNRHGWTIRATSSTTGGARFEVGGLDPTED